VNFSIPLCAKWHFFQGSIRLVDMRFSWHVPNSPRNKNLKPLNPYLLYKMLFFGPQNSAILLEHREKTFFFQIWTLWSCKRYGMNVRFGGHINIQVSYKIFQLEVQKKTSILHNMPCFQKRLFWGNFGLNVAIDV
jgi:hypothetical protein